MIRNEIFRWVTLLAAQQYHAAVEQLAAGAGGWTATDLQAALEPYWEEFDEILTDVTARGADKFEVTEAADRWPVTQILADPDDFGEWRLVAYVDIEASKSADRPIIQLEAVTRL